MGLSSQQGWSFAWNPSLIEAHGLVVLLNWCSIWGLSREMQMSTCCIAKFKRTEPLKPHQNTSIVGLYIAINIELRLVEPFYVVSLFRLPTMLMLTLSALHVLTVHTISWMLFFFSIQDWRIFPLLSLEQGYSMSLMEERLDQFLKVRLHQALYYR